MTTGILDYLSELKPDEVSKVFEIIQRRSLKIQFKSPENEKVGFVQFVATESANKLCLIFKKDFNLINQTLTFKIKIGTEIYFFKTNIKSLANDFFIQGPFKLYKLIRRKNVRYIVPDSWAQSGCILAAQKKIMNSKFNIIEISNSGMRILVFPQLPRYEKKQQIQITFKIHKRAVITVSAIIKHMKNNKLGGPILGLEFVFENAMIQNRIQNICEDLAHSVAHKSSLKA
ncbi:MAG: hypothetical protein WA160_11195 [Pseudobdellovibrio sp.]